MRKKISASTKGIIFPVNPEINFLLRKGNKIPAKYISTEYFKRIDFLPEGYHEHLKILVLATICGLSLVFLIIPLNLTDLKSLFISKYIIFYNYIKLVYLYLIST